MRVDTKDLVGITEIADALDVNRNVVSNWIVRYASFPKPVRVLACGSLWCLTDISKWHDLRHAVIKDEDEWAASTRGFDVT